MRKLRTHEHIIEDLGFNYIERQILKGSHIMHRYGHGDYGMDGEIIKLKNVVHCFVPRNDDAL